MSRTAAVPRSGPVSRAPTVVLPQTRLFGWAFAIAIAGFVVHRGYSTLVVYAPFGADPEVLPSWLRYGPMVALAMAVFSTTGGVFSRIRQDVRPWLWILAVWSTGLAIGGVVAQNPRYYYMLDFELTWMLFVGLMIGSRDELWPYIRRAYLVAFAFAIPIVLLGLLELDLTIREFGGKFLAISYESQYLLWPTSFFLLLHATEKNRTARTLVVAAFALALFEQLLFQKRAPMARLLILAVCALYVSGREGRRQIVRSVTVAIAISVGIAIALSLTLWALNLEFGRLTDAFISRATGLQGIEATSLQNARFQYALLLVRSLDGLSLWWGKGFGGYVLNPAFGFTILTSQGDLANGAAMIEVGHTWAILKGGIFFAILFNLPLLAALSNLKALVSPNAYDRAAWIFVAVTAAFMIAETLMSHPHQLSWLLTAACMGRLLREPRPRIRGEFQRWARRSTGP